MAVKSGMCACVCMHLLEQKFVNAVENVIIGVQSDCVSSLLRSYLLVRSMQP